MADPAHRWLTTEQAAAAAGVQPATIRKWKQRGHLDAYRIPGRPGRWYRELDVLKAESATRRRSTRPDAVQRT